MVAVARRNLNAHQITAHLQVGHVEHLPCKPTPD
jgi:hypothetical protein